MKRIPSIAETRKLVTRELQWIHGFEQVKQSKGEIGWIVERDGWFSLRWIYLQEYDFGFPRFRNDIVHELPKSFWKLPYPKIPKFEITVHHSQIDKKFIHSMSDFVSYVFEDRPEIYTWDIFDNVSCYPNYGWSKLARDLYKDKKRKK
jgi:hypothetical protein